MFQALMPSAETRSFNTQGKNDQSEPLSMSCELFQQDRLWALSFLNPLSLKSPGWLHFCLPLQPSPAGA